MIISKTPFRISFFGGGTDYPAWFEKYGGAVLSTTIDKYCYITLRYLPPFFEHKHRIVYSIVENVRSAGQIRHPVVRSILQYLKIDKGIELHHDGDLPARSGLGSSSSFTVGMLNSIYALKGKMISKGRLAKEAIHIERGVLKESVGSQDQISVAYGGLKKIV
ncbi:MAG: kinase, partial [Candidatus Omnitrophota bacterium]